MWFVLFFHSASIPGNAVSCNITAVCNETSLPGRQIIFKKTLVAPVISSHYLLLHLIICLHLSWVYTLVLGAFAYSSLKKLFAR